MDITEKTSAVCENIKNFRLPRWNDLPDLDLYMDQVIALINKFIAPICSKNDKALTPSMVNNYVKLGAMPPPEKKKYSRIHLAQLIIICVLKQVMPIPTISELIKMALIYLSEQQMLDTFANYYEKSAQEIAERTKARLGKIQADPAFFDEFLPASSAIRSQIELRISENIALAAEKDSPEQA